MIINHWVQWGTEFSDKPRWERFGEILEDGNEDFGRLLFGDMEYQKRMELQKIGKWRVYYNLI